MEYPHNGINRRDLDAIFIENGGEISCPNRTGEVRYRHRLLRETPRADGRRKDAPRNLVRYVRRVIDAVAKESSGVDGSVCEKP